MINELKPNQVIVVGTNLNGDHYGGAAKQAYEDFGLAWGVGEGISGQTYAFPTLDDDMMPLDTAELEVMRDDLYRTAEGLPAITFLLTKVGTGIAGIPEEKMKALFINAPNNIIKPKDWQE